jgi:hypothetical protein
MKAFILQAASDHGEMTVWEEAWTIFIDPAHIMAELGS